MSGAGAFNRIGGGAAAAAQLMAQAASSYKVYSLGFGHFPWKWKAPRGTSTRLSIVYDEAGRPELLFSMRQKSTEGGTTADKPPQPQLLRIPLNAVAVIAQDFSVKSMFDGNDRERPTCHLALELRLSPYMYAKLSGAEQAKFLRAAAAFARRVRPQLWPPSTSCRPRPT